MKLLVTARDAAEAHLIAHALGCAGIRAAVQGEMLALGRGELPLTPQTLPQVWVNEPDFDAARAIAEAFFTEAEEVRSGAAGPPWRCEPCGEEIEGQFAACWNCGADRPPDTADPPGRSASLD